MQCADAFAKLRAGHARLRVRYSTPIRERVWFTTRGQLPAALYGFYVERASVLGCGRIESISRQSPDVVWGNHTALETQTRELGPAKELSIWLG
jgi:hypothetical protein